MSDRDCDLPSLCHDLGQQPSCQIIGLFALYVSWPTKHSNTAALLSFPSSSSFLPPPSPPPPLKKANLALGSRTVYYSRSLPWLTQHPTDPYQLSKHMGFKNREWVGASAKKKKRMRERKDIICPLMMLCTDFFFFLFFLWMD